MSVLTNNPESGSSSHNPSNLIAALQRGVSLAAQGADAYLDFKIRNAEIEAVERENKYAGQTYPQGQNITANQAVPLPSITTSGAFLENNRLLIVGGLGVMALLGLAAWKLS